MNDYNDVKMKISKLESMISKGVFSTNNPNWKLVWQQIKIVGSNFKGINFPTKEEHQQSWDKFQDIVNEVKCRQKEEQHKWDQKKAESIKLRDSIIAQAHRAELPSGIGNLILVIATMGISEILNTIMGPFDEKKRELQSAGVELKKGWDMLNMYKVNMLGCDKHDAFQALNKAKENLDSEWNTYQQERQQVYDNYQREREQKNQAWRQHTEENIRNLDNRREKLNDVLSHKESHLEELYDKLNEAWSDDYRSTISGYIDEEESKIQDIRNKLNDIEGWLYEAKKKLNS